jgi:hypothetical protein
MLHALLNTTTTTTITTAAAIAHDGLPTRRARIQQRGRARTGTSGVDTVVCDDAGARAGAGDGSKRD